jgi:hypothetical protein
MQPIFLIANSQVLVFLKKLSRGVQAGRKKVGFI